MKNFILTLFSLLILLFVAACSSDEPSNPDEIHYGSPRDWTYSGQQVHFYINDVEQTSVSEITVSSIQYPSNILNQVFPFYDSTLKVKGLEGKNKVTSIQVKADTDRFEGTTTLDGVNYSVTGEFTGNPFEHHDTFGIIVRLDKVES